MYLRATIILSLLLSVGVCREVAGSERDLRDSQVQVIPQSGVGPLHKYTYTQLHMAMPVRLTVWADTEQQAQVACKAAFRRITEIELALTDYDARSELRQLCKSAGQGPVHVSEDLFTVLSYSKRLSDATKGAFDPTAGPVVQLWRKARTTGVLPRQQANEDSQPCDQATSINGALALVGSDGLLLDAKLRTAELIRAGMMLDFGGVAKGYIGDAAIAELRTHGIRRSQYRAGGDIVLGDSPPDSIGWRIELPRLPNQFLSNCGVSVSGDTAQFVEIDGKRYSHIVDPRTGMAVTSRQFAIIVAPSGMQSDGLASAGCVMKPEQFQRLVHSRPNTKAWTFNMDSDAP